MVDRLWKDRGPGAPSPEEMAWMASQTYRDPGFDGAESFTKVPNGGKVKVKDRKCIVLDRVNDRSTGLDAYLITDKNRSFAVMAIRGTDDWQGSFSPWLDFLSPVLPGHPDSGADAEYAMLGQVPKQARLASDVFQEWRSKYKIRSWGVTGHSLGGMDVQYVLAKNGGDIKWAYNFSGPNVYPVLAAHEKEGAKSFGHKLYSFGGAQDSIYQHFREQPMMGFMGYMDFEDPGNHNLGSQFRFDGDGNPVLMGGRLHDVLVEALSGDGSRVGSRAATIMLSNPVAFRVMARQVALEEKLEKVRQCNRRIAGEMREGFGEVVREYGQVHGTWPEDVERVVGELGLAPERNVDQAGLDRVERNMRELLEQSRGWVKSLVRVVERKISEDAAANKVLSGVTAAVSPSLHFLYTLVPEKGDVKKGLKGGSVNR